MKTAITLLASLLIHNINTKTIDESETGALLSFPSVIDGPLYNQTYDVTPAQFGYQRYGGSLEGVLVLPANKTYHTECPDSSQEPLNSNPYIHYIQDWFTTESAITDYILVVDRLDCYFVDKILHAQLMGASGVIMCDWNVEPLFTMWMPEDWRDTISIPSVLLDNQHCHTLMAHLGVSNWNPTDIQNMSYPTVEQMNWTYATIEWGLPHPDDRVEYELWTSSNDYLGSEFKHNFNTTAILLDQAEDTQFTPHMYIINGSGWGCDEVINGSHTLQCSKQCTNNGRYCAVDPEYDMSIGLDGMDVIQENLRSLCVWNYDKTTHPGDDIMWWDYAVLWDENCGVYSNSSTNFHENCSFAQMDKLKTDGLLSEFVRTKILQTGGYGYTDGVNSILKTETRLRYNRSIFHIPTVVVNEFLIHGNIDCKPPVTVATCEVLSAICAGFIEGTQPSVCYVTPAPTIAVCNESEKDCGGTCFGSMLLDACDECLLVSSHEWNACIGCNGQVGEMYDCQGTCGGYYSVNPCGYCKDRRQQTFATFGVDCEGGCDMDLRVDECGQCITESDLNWDSCIGCDNVADSGKAFNECGRCVTATDTNFANYGKDCRGICSTSVSDTYYEDDCGMCLLPADDLWNDCLPDNTEVPALKRKESELTTVIVTVCIVAFLIIVAAVIIIGALWKKQTSINARFDSLASTYVTMDENPQHSFPISNKGMTVPDDPESVEDE